MNPLLLLLSLAVAQPDPGRLAGLEYASSLWPASGVLARFEALATTATRLM